jgi:Cu(I)/Ag(I) efflux system membrane fusion protein
MKFPIKLARLTVLFLLPAALVLGAGLFLAGCSRSQSDAASQGAIKEKTLYTCGMHPQVIQDHPGICPICEMKLTPIRKEAGTGNPAASPGGERKPTYYKSTMMPGETSPTPRKDSMGMDMVPVYEQEAASAESSTITVDPVTIQKMGIRTATVTRGPLRRLIRTVGMIDYNETTLADVTTKSKGWVEKLYADATGQQVHRGDPLFELYSPELYSAQQEYLLALEGGTNTPGAVSLRTSARTKLKFFDISDEQIAEVERTGKPHKTLRIVAPQDGFVMEKMVVEGQMVEPGMKIYRLADLGLVWVQAQIYEQDLAYLKLGQEATVTLSYLPDREFRGRVTYIYPNIDEKTRTARVRMEFHNPGYFLKPGMFATVEVASELAHGHVGAASGAGHLPGSQRVAPGRAHCHLRTVPARFRKPAPGGDSEDEGTETGRASRSRAKSRHQRHARAREGSRADSDARYQCARHCEIHLPHARAHLHPV